ncbi:MAG: GTPase ObgE [Simkania sp.]|nr:GTPase ObgE [Simkania sp.]
MFLDSTVVTFSAGKGGNGVVTWRREKFIPKGGPTGGNGGRGGSVYLRTDPGLFSLEAFRNKRLINAKSGNDGGSNLKQGKNGEDLIVLIPCGTLIKDLKTNEILFDCSEPNQTFLLCQGGRGGKGNHCFKSPTHQAPNICTPGADGELKEIQLELKLIADVGLLGMPNAGKSTLLSKLTNTRVKIGAYPFTTLSPNLSFVQFEDFSRVLIADIPGIISGAHIDRGLGLSFLKHIERTSVLIYLIDVSLADGSNPIESYSILRNELTAYRPELLEKPFLIALNKVDEEGAKEGIKTFREAYKGDPSMIFEISAQDGAGVGTLLEAMRSIAQASDKRFF